MRMCNRYKKMCTLSTLFTSFFPSLLALIFPLSFFLSLALSPCLSLTHTSPRKLEPAMAAAPFAAAMAGHNSSNNKHSSNNMIPIYHCVPYPLPSYALLATGGGGGGSGGGTTGASTKGRTGDGAGDGGWIDGAHPDTGLIDLEEISNELTEVDATIGDKVEGELPTIPLILGVHDLHGQLLGPDLALTDGQGLGLILTLAHEHGDLTGLSGTVDALRVDFLIGTTLGTAGTSEVGHDLSLLLLELLDLQGSDGVIDHLTQILTPISLDDDQVTPTNWGRGHLIDPNVKEIRPTGLELDNIKRGGGRDNMKGDTLTHLGDGLSPGLRVKVLLGLVVGQATVLGLAELI